MVGSLVWNTVLITAGYLLAAQWERVLEFTEPFQTFVVVIVGVVLVALIVRKVVIARKTRASEEALHPGFAHETIDEIAHKLETQASEDPELRSKPDG